MPKRLNAVPESFTDGSDQKTTIVGPVSPRLSTSEDISKFNEPELAAVSPT